MCVCRLRNHQGSSYIVKHFRCVCWGKGAKKIPGKALKVVARGTNHKRVKEDKRESKVGKVRKK